MKVLKVKLAFKQNSDKLIATELLYDFEPWDEITEKIEYPAIDEILDFIKKTYNSYLEQVQKWQEMIIRSEDYIWEILKDNFNEKDIMTIIWDHDHFNVYFYEDIKYDIESYYKDDKMFFNIFDPYLKSWSKLHNTINFADLNNAWISLADNLEIGLKPIDN